MTEVCRNAEEAEAAFYRAFETGDYDAMMRIWSTQCQVMCIHPMGPRLSNLVNIAESWQQILSNSAPRKFDILTIQTWESDDIAVRVVNETISVPGSGTTYEPVLATNVYQKFGESWFMTAHHASLDASKQLAAPNLAPDVSGTRH